MSISEDVWLPPCSSLWHTGNVQPEHLKNSESGDSEQGLMINVCHRDRMQNTEVCAGLVQPFLRMAAFHTREEMGITKFLP